MLVVALVAVVEELDVELAGVVALVGVVVALDVELAGAEVVVGDACLADPPQPASAMRDRAMRARVPPNRLCTPISMPTGTGWFQAAGVCYRPEEPPDTVGTRLEGPDDGPYDVLVELVGAVVVVVVVGFAAATDPTVPTEPTVPTAWLTVLETVPVAVPIVWPTVATVLSITVWTGLGVEGVLLGPWLPVSGFVAGGVLDLGVSWAGATGAGTGPAATDGSGAGVAGAGGFGAGTDATSAAGVAEAAAGLTVACGAGGNSEVKAACSAEAGSSIPGRLCTRSAVVWSWWGSSTGTPSRRPPSTAPTARLAMPPVATLPRASHRRERPCPARLDPPARVDSARPLS